MGLENIEFAMTLEKKYEIDISDGELATLVTVGNAFDLVALKLKTAGRSVNEERLRGEVVQLALRQGDYRPKKQRTPVTRQTQLIEDLGWG